MRNLFTFFSHLTEEDITNLRARQSYYKHKYTGLPKLPQGAIGSNEFMRQSHENIAALGETTKSGAGFLRFNDAAEKVALWVADECADKFNTATMVFVDGTFYVTPPGYHQVITISGAIGCKFVPLAWAIVPDRLESTYRLVFRELKRTVEARAGNFTPPRAMTDFEKGMRNALRDAWHIPLGDLRGCIFHALKAWYQRLRKYGLEGAYREKVAAGEPHSMLNKWLHQTFGLPCLPPRDVASAWNILKQRAPVDPRVDKFIAYLEKNFVGQGATWDPQCWAAEPSERHRTNNCAEGLHRALKSKFGSAHPNIQVFVEKLLRYHETVRQKLRSTDRRPMPALKSELDREELWKQMTDHSLTLLAYLERVGRINTVPQSVSQ